MLGPESKILLRFSDQNALLLTDQNELLLTDQNAFHARGYIYGESD